jgi:hypothetical protein
VPIAGDDVPEGNEAFAVYLSSSLPVDAAMGRATILDDDAAPAAAPALPVQTTGAPAPAPARIAPAVDDLAPDVTARFLGMRTSVRVRVACPAGEASCTGWVFVRRDLKRSFGVARFQLKGGQSRTVREAWEQI